MQDLSLSVIGMTCEGCERRITVALESVLGVRGVEADHRTGEVRVRLDTKLSSRPDVRRAIERAGYEVSR